MKASGQGHIMGTAFRRLSGGFFQTLTLAIALSFLSPTRADALVAPASSEAGSDLAAFAYNRSRVPQVSSNFLLPGTSLEIAGLSSHPGSNTLENWPAVSISWAGSDPLPAPFLSVPGPLKLGTDVFGSVVEFPTPFLGTGGDLLVPDASVASLGMLHTGTTGSAISITQFTRVPEPSVVILSGIALALALFGRKRGNRVYSR
jgi:hypothetical protein